MVVRLMTRNWWVLLIRGVAAAAFGALSFLVPGVSLAGLALMFGAYALVDGILNVVAAVRPARGKGPRWALLVEGLVSLAAGVISLVWPGITVLVVLGIIAGWAILTGVAGIVEAVRFRKEITNEWLLALSGVLSVLLGVSILLTPLAGAVAVAWTVGGFSLVFGGMLIALSFKLRRLGRESAGYVGLPDADTRGGLAA